MCRRWVDSGGKLVSHFEFGKGEKPYIAYCERVTPSVKESSVLEGQASASTSTSSEAWKRTPTRMGRPRPLKARKDIDA